MRKCKERGIIPKFLKVNNSHDPIKSRKSKEITQKFEEKC